MQKSDSIITIIFTLIWLTVIYLFSANAKGANADYRPIPESQFDSKTHIWTARAMVAEAGWDNENDHIAIAYVFSRRWHFMKKRWPNLRFLDVVFRYSKGLGANRREYSRRQIWIRALSPSMLEPEGWPAESASWRRHKPFWARTIDRAALWAEGRLLDPCRGLATHFGGVMDKPRPGMVPVDCGETKNIFYRVR